MIDDRTGPYGLLLLRVTTGLALLAHSLYLKVFVFTMSGTADFFRSIGLPGPLAWVVLLIEIGTGAMLIFGVKPVSQQLQLFRC